MSNSVSLTNNDKPKLKVAVLVSGNGSNLQVLIDAMQTGELPIDIVGVISNAHDAYAITRAQNAGIKTAVLSHVSEDGQIATSGKRMGIKSFERHASGILQSWQPDLIVLAGFMRVLSAEFIDGTAVPMINLHPSLLPKFKGLDTHQRAIDAGENWHGCSVHLVTAKLDGGQVLTQALLELTSDDTADSLQSRVQQLEHQILPWTVNLIATGALELLKISRYAQGSATGDNRADQYLPDLPYKLCFFESI